jgi:hypothetical protein
VWAVTATPTISRSEINVMPAEETPSSFRFSIGCLLSVATVVALMVGGCLALIRYVDGVDIIATLDCGRDREIVITADRAWEISQPICYLIRVDGNVVVPPTHFANNDPPNVPGFVLVSANDGDLVGVSYAGDPADYLFIHDFSNRKTYDSGDRPDLQALLDETRTGTSTGG